jgi:L,D-transpeptidase ErfK/SrfK
MHVVSSPFNALRPLALMLALALLALLLGPGSVALAQTNSDEQSSLGQPEEPDRPAIEAKARVVINIPSRTLAVWQGEDKLREFPVGVGRAAFPTPLGNYSVISKVKNPLWEDPFLPKGRSRYAQGALGTRWMGFKKVSAGEYGIHGTPVAASVGKFSSHGCVRMLIPDAEALYDMIDEGTPVEVTYDLIMIEKDGLSLNIRVFPDWFKKGRPTVWQTFDRIKRDFPSAKVDYDKVQWALMTQTEKALEIGKVDPAIKIRISN